VDSYFWAKFPLWPEFSGIYFNVLEGKSIQWGVSLLFLYLNTQNLITFIQASPPLTYVTSHLPKLLLGSLPLSIVGIFADGRIRSLLLPSCAFISMISFLAHKEWRFIVYVVPVFNIAGSRGAKWM